MAGASGLDRASLATINPRLPLAVLRLRRSPAEALRQVELSLARGLLDQQATRLDAALTPDERAAQAKQLDRIARVQPQILFLLARFDRTEPESATLEQLLAERREAEGQLADLAATASQREVASLEAIRKALPADAALMLWIDGGSRISHVQEHWVCVVRSTGEPHWERLPGTGAEGTWTSDDFLLPSRLRDALEISTPRSELEAIAKRFRDQRIVPALPHLAGVKNLHVVAVNWMSGVPVELLAPEFTISYVPSGTVLARARDGAPPTGRRALAVGDPVFNRPGTTTAPADKPLPPGGVLINQVLPGSSSARAGLRRGDVILKYADTEIKDTKDLGAAIAASAKSASVPVTLWRETADRPVVRDVAAGALGVVLATEPAPAAIASRRQADAQLQSLQRGGWADLPGSRLEVDRLRQLLGDDCLALTDSDASEQRLEEIRKSGELSRFRYLHLATHGEGNTSTAFESVLILAQDNLPGVIRPRVGEPNIDGSVSAREVLEFWKLDAELVTLSACESALGRVGSGEGLLGFAQAFLHAGSRSVCLSLWKVDDVATALLMDRFYHNLLVKRMGKAASLDEAKRWLRGLSGEDAVALTAKLSKGVARGQRSKGEELHLVVPAGNPKGPAARDAKPFAHPRFWAAFILIGDPN